MRNKIGSPAPPIHHPGVQGRRRWSPRRVEGEEDKALLCFPDLTDQNRSTAQTARITMYQLLEITRNQFGLLERNKDYLDLVMIKPYCKR